MRTVVHDCVRGFESHSCYIFEQFPIKIKSLEFNWSAAYSARQESQAVKSSRFQTLSKFKIFRTRSCMWVQMPLW